MYFSRSNKDQVPTKYRKKLLIIIQCIGTHLISVLLTVVCLLLWTIQRCGSVVLTLYEITKE
jgi:hypothetical protein